LGRETAKPKARPSNKVKQVFEEVSSLPRRQPDKVVEFVSAFVRHQQKTKSEKTASQKRVVKRQSLL
jgi:hypothetical protein